MYIYHGTDKFNAMSILETGFTKGTYFTQYLDSSLLYGGEYVFAVWVEKDDEDLGWMRSEPDEEPWQLQIKEDWSPDRISSLVHYQAEMLYVKDENRKEGKCPTCHGYGELFKSKESRDSRYWLPKTHFIHMKSLKEMDVCPECHGYGDVGKYKEMQQ